MVAKQSDVIPTDIPGRLGYAGHGLYGRYYRAKLAAGLKISRTTLHQWETDGKRDPHRDIDGEIADLIDRERDAAAERGADLTALRNKFLRVKQVA